MVRDDEIVSFAVQTTRCVVARDDEKSMLEWRGATKPTPSALMWHLLDVLFICEFHTYLNIFFNLVYCSIGYMTK